MIAGAKGADQMQVRLQVETDENGTARVAKVARAGYRPDGADPVFRAFAERAVRAVLSPHLRQSAAAARHARAAADAEFPLQTRGMN